MSGVKKTRIVGMVLFVSLVFSCASNTGFVSYREGLFQGYRSLQNADYQPALQQFLRASQGDPSRAWPLALAGQAAYRAGIGNCRYLGKSCIIDRAYAGIDFLTNARADANSLTGLGRAEQN